MMQTWKESEYLDIDGKYIVHEVPTTVFISVASITDE